MNNISFLRKPEDIIRIGIVLMMMRTTVMSVERRWMDCEVSILYWIPALFAFGLVVQIWRKQRLECTLADVIAVIWFAYFVGRTWIGNEWPCQMEFLKTTELFLLYVGLRVAFNRTKMSAWVLIGFILAFGCYEAWLGLSQMYGDDISRHRLFALTGNFLNPGPYSAYLMIGVVVGLVALKNMPNRTIMESVSNVVHFGKIANKMPNVVNNVLEKTVNWIKGITWRHLVIAAMVLMAMMLPATWSRAAFLGVAVVALFVYRDKYWKYRCFVWGAIAFAGIVFYFIKQGSADGRLIIWRATLTTWINSPWLGVGVGGFYNAFAEGVVQLSTSGMDFSSADVPDGAYNILLKIIVEQGVIGGVMVISLSIASLKKLSKNSKPLFCGIVALLVFAMFSYPFDLLPYKVITILVVTWSESVGRKKMFEIGRGKVFILTTLLGFASWQAGKIAGESHNIEKEYGMSFDYDSLYSIEKGYEWLTAESDNHKFLFAFGKKLRKEGRYNDSNAILHQGTRCSADPMFYVLMGNNYKDMKHYDLAEQAYNKAFSVMPNRLYPLYQLMLLYQDSGDMKKAKAMAKRVIEKKPKIESRATREMKKKALEFLSQH